MDRGKNFRILVISLNHIILYNLNSDTMKLGTFFAFN